MCGPTYLLQNFPNMLRVAVLKGGFQGLLEQPAAAAAARGHSGANYPQQQQQQQLPFLHRDALALLLDQVPLPESAYAMCNSIINQRDHMQQQQQHIAAAAGEGLAAANGSSGSSQRLLVIDVRRHDERTLYGSIPGAVHIPGRVPYFIALKHISGLCVCM